MNGWIGASEPRSIPTMTLLERVPEWSCVPTSGVNQCKSRTLVRANARGYSSPVLMRAEAGGQSDGNVEVGGRQVGRLNRVAVAATSS